MITETTSSHFKQHSALMRLPKKMNRAEKKKKVMEVIQFLELSHVMDSVIGNEGSYIYFGNPFHEAFPYSFSKSIEERGISGGQRKRVNIGMELVAEPSILFLVSSIHIAKKSNSRVDFHTLQRRMSLPP